MNAKIVTNLNDILSPKQMTVFGNGFVFNENTKRSHFIIKKISKNKITILTPTPITEHIDDISTVSKLIMDSVEYHEKEFYKLRVEPHLKKLT